MLTLSKTLCHNSEIGFKLSQVNMTHKQIRKKKKAKASDVQQTFSICSWVSQAQCSGSHKPLKIDLLQRRVSVTESASHGQCLPPEKSSGLPLLYSPSPNSTTPSPPLDQGLNQLHLPWPAANQGKGGQGQCVSLTLPAGPQFNNRNRIHRMGLSLS